jgi:hypothetical protein
MKLAKFARKGFTVLIMASDAVLRYGGSLVLVRQRTLKLRCRFLRLRNRSLTPS